LTVDEEKMSQFLNPFSKNFVAQLKDLTKLVLEKFKLSFK